MCMFKKGGSSAPASTQQATTPAASIIAANDNAGARRAADAETRIRRSRRGAAANILTTARGIPSTRKLGDPA